MSRSFDHEEDSDEETGDATEEDSDEETGNATEEDSDEETEDAEEDSDEESADETEDDAAAEEDNSDEEEDSDDESGDATEENTDDESGDATEENTDEESADANRNSYFQVITKKNWHDFDHAGEGTDSENDEYATRGPDNTVFVNFTDLCETMHRESEHVRDFLRNELGNAIPDEQEGLVVYGRYAPKDFERILHGFIDEYVICHECESLDTILSDENNHFVVRCEKCSYEESLAPIRYIPPRRLGRTGTSSNSG